MCVRVCGGVSEGLDGVVGICSSSMALHMVANETKLIGRVASLV